MRIPQKCIAITIVFYLIYQEKFLLIGNDILVQNSIFDISCSHLKKYSKPSSSTVNVFESVIKTKSLLRILYKLHILQVFC